MTKTKKIDLLIPFLDNLFPEARCELIYHKDYELVIAVMLSAQTTDASINAVTPVLFSKYSSLEELAKADLKDIENIIHSIGLYKNKAKNVLGIAQTLLKDFNGVVPSDKDLLQTLPGVGNKTAGVVRAEFFKIPDLPVDTHILRISKRLELANQDDDAYEVEMKLKKIIDESRYIKTHHQLIHFGRYFCTARNPRCSECRLIEICNKK